MSELSDAANDCTAGLRLTSGTDSNVGLGGWTKGRSPSGAVNRKLQRGCAWSVMGAETHLGISPRHQAQSVRRRLALGGYTSGFSRSVVVDSFVAAREAVRHHAVGSRVHWRTVRPRAGLVRASRHIIAFRPGGYLLCRIFTAVVLASLVPRLCFDSSVRADQFPEVASESEGKEGNPPLWSAHATGGDRHSQLVVWKHPCLLWSRRWAGGRRCVRRSMCGSS